MPDSCWLHGDGTTSGCLPLQVVLISSLYFVDKPCRIWKQLVRLFSDRVVLDDLDVNLHSRDAIIKLQSLIHRQLSSPRFKSFLRYSWVKAGYIDATEENTTFVHPVKYCFPAKMPLNCQFTTCAFSAFIRCSRCGKFMCFYHFYDEYHLCV